MRFMNKVMGIVNAGLLSNSRASSPFAKKNRIVRVGEKGKKDSKEEKRLTPKVRIFPL
jgi:hypothetical protein